MRSSTGRILNVDLDSPSTAPLYRRVFEHVRSRIVDGTLAPNSPVPSTRALARELRVSRSTVVLAYEQLRDEGYLAGKMGAATRVRANLPDRLLRSSVDTQATLTTHTGQASRRGLALTSIERHPSAFFGHGPRAFRAGVPAVDTFPVDVWGRLMARRWQRVTAKSLAYGDTFGYRPLREALVEYLGSARNVRCSVDQVMIVPGSQLGLDLAARVLLDPGDEAWLEDPGYHGARGALTAAGARIVPVPVDAEGLSVAHGRRLAPSARVAFCTPSRQLPLGVTMSVERRLELLAWAQAAGSWIIEDDYDSEFRFSTRPVQSLHGMGSPGLVVYAGTFSKVTFPAVRLGYMVVPDSLIDVFAAARTFSDYSPPYLMQAAMTDFMTQGHFERHIRRMRAVYHDRQRLLVGLMQRQLGDWLRVEPSDAGMSIIGWLPDGVDDRAVAAEAARRSVDVLAISSFAVNRVRPGLLLGFAGVREAEIREGVTHLATLFRAVERGGGLPKTSRPSKAFGKSSS